MTRRPSGLSTPGRVVTTVECKRSGSRSGMRNCRSSGSTSARTTTTNRCAKDGPRKIRMPEPRTSPRLTEIDSDTVKRVLRDIGSIPGAVPLPLDVPRPIWRRRFTEIPAISSGVIVSLGRRVRREATRQRCHLAMPRDTGTLFGECVVKHGPNDSFETRRANRCGHAAASSYRLSDRVPLVC